ncbi:hypothetical protein KDAU_71370 [Dictyobacter aurantiacus]|uniref:Uncharacterized protein n=1 Tax=Dictyobacter aurantiacus TaxID=1936993 RepID=A0A401ZSC1_9CHLR|nr:hypothetical protein KDAU_71370 [Dictyobacter aurantiacus]
MHLTQVLDKREAKASQSIPVGNDEHSHITSNDTIYHGKKLFALKVETATNFFKPFINNQSASRTELLKMVPLIHEIGLLCWAGNTAVDKTPLLLWAFFQPEHQSEVFIGKVALIRNGAMRLESAFAVPSLQRLGNDPYQFCKFTKCVHKRRITHKHTQFNYLVPSPSLAFLDYKPQALASATQE